MGSKVKNFFRPAWRIALAAPLLFAAACEDMGNMSNPIANLGLDDGDKSATVALLLPYGDSDPGVQSIANSAEQAARLALAGVAEGVTLELKTYDTAGNPETAAVVAQKAVAEGADVIVGPLFAEAAIAAGKAVQPSGVSVLTLSNNVSAAGGNVYVLGNTFENVADRLVSYASRQGKQKALIVHARTPSEDAGRAALQQALVNNGVSASVEGYEFSQEAIVAAARRIGNRVNVDGTDVVLMTADYPGGLPFLAQLLPEAGVDPATVQYGGLARWDAQPSAFNLPAIQGGWFAIPNEAQYSAFRSRYQAAYGAAPHALASIAFDGVAAVAASVAEGGRQPLSGVGLTRARGFEGASGIFRLQSNGRVQRGMAIATIRGNQVVVIDGAPSTFGGIGF